MRVFSFTLGQMPRSLPRLRWRRDHQSREAWPAQPESRGTDGPASILPRFLPKGCWLLLALLLAGCESVTDRFSPVPPKLQVFNGDQFAVNAAALQAFKRLDFLVTRAKALDIEAVSRIHTSVAFADSRQLTARLHLSNVGPGKTEVELTVTEQVQSERMGGTSQQTMREHGFFQIYFATLQEVLDENAPTLPGK